MNSHDAALAQRLQQPTAASLAQNLPIMGESLANALTELSRKPTPAQCDDMLHRLQAASHSVSRLRATLMMAAHR